MISLLTDAVSSLEKVAGPVIRFAAERPELARRVFDAVGKLITADNLEERVQALEEIALKESYRHGFTPTPDRKPVGG